MSTANKDNDEKETILVREEKDGSATVELPPGVPSPQAEPESDQGEHDIGTDEQDEAERQQEIVAQGAVDADAERLRELKRNKRKARKLYHRQVAAEKDVRINLLTNEKNNLQERVAILERKAHGSDIALINKGLEDEKAAIAYAKQKIAEAASSNNGEMLASAQEMWFDHRRKHEALEAVKKTIISPNRQPAIQGPDPYIQRHASEWMSENPWYIPSPNRHGRGGDPDSEIADIIDKGLASEGWNPQTEEYWAEFRARLPKYLPHRYTEGVDEKQNRSSRPRSAVVGSGRESASSSGGHNRFTLSIEQVRAMKDAGMWEDEAKRKRMLERYQREARPANERNRS